MELYVKKINIQNKLNKRLRDKYYEVEYSQPKNEQNTYFREILKKKAVSQPRNKALNLSTDNLRNVRSNLEDILGNEKNKKKAIKYVIQIGKNKKYPSSYDIKQRYQKTDSPKKGKKAFFNDFSSYKNSPYHTYDDQKGGSQPKKIRYISITDYTNTDYKNSSKKKIIMKTAKMNMKCLLIMKKSKKIIIEIKNQKL